MFYSIPEILRKKSRAIKIKLSEKPDSQLLEERKMSAKFATRQNLRTDRAGSVNIANSKFARDVVCK